MGAAEEKARGVVVAPSAAKQKVSGGQCSTQTGSCQTDLSALESWGEEQPTVEVDRVGRAKSGLH